MSLDLTTFAAALKKYFTDKRVANLVFKNRPFFATVPKNEKVRGKSYEVPITIGGIGGRSKEFASAVASKSASTHNRFSVPMSRNYGLANIDGLTMQASDSERGAFMRATTSEIESTLRELANDCANDLYSDGTGLRGTVAAIGASPTIGLGSPEATRPFAVGQTLEYVLQASGVTGAVVGGAATPTTAKIVAVDREAGTITLDADPGLAVGDFLFQRGDASSAGAREDKLVGLPGWLKTAADVATEGTFFGVTRSADATKMAGVIYDAVTPGDTIETALVNAGAALFNQGGSPDTVYMNPKRVAQLDRELEQRGRYDKVKSTRGDVGFESIVVHTGGGTVRVMGDPWCPMDRAYMLQSNTWELISIGPVPKLLTHDGNKLLRVADEDAVELRAGYYANLSCSAPGWNCMIILG